MAGVYLEVDATEVIRMANNLAKSIGQEKAQRILDRTVWKTGKTLKAPISSALRTVYAAKASFIKSGIRSPRMESNVCVIPLSGVRGRIGQVFPRGGTKKNIKAEILLGKKSPLPKKMTHQGGNPPFRSGALVRTTSAAGGHPTVVGLSVPQMPMPAAKGNVPVEKLLEERMIGIMEKATRDILGGWV